MEVLKIDAEKIVVASDRVRKDFNKEKLQRLAASFKAVGQIQPGVCVELEPGKYQLVAGERRLRACRLAEIPFAFVLKAEADEVMLLEIELEENLNREGLSWQEEVDGVEKLHRLREGQKETRGQSQSLEDTAVELDRSRGSVHRDIELAEWSKEFAEIRDAKTKADAYKIIKRYKAELLRNQLLQQAIDKEPSTSFGSVDGKQGGEPSPAGAVTPEVLNVGGVTIPKSLLLEFDERIELGTMEEKLPEFQDGFFDLVFFDPPWGANLSQIRDKPPGTEDFEDEPETFSEKIEEWLALIYRKMATNSHLYLFFGIRFHNLVYGALRKAGFVENGIPLIWYKQGAHVTRNPEIWPGRSYEPVAFARKGNKNLVTLGSPDTIITPAPTPLMKKSHPNAKHPDLYLELIKRSALPGDKLLDPMCGSGMLGVAAEEYRTAKRLDWRMIEKSQTFRELALENVIRGYGGIVSKEREPIDRPRSEVGHQYDNSVLPVAEDFHSLQPGTPDWMRFWKAHPEQQDLMLEWKKSQELGEAGI